jgi:hypothetical protein
MSLPLAALLLGFGSPLPIGLPGPLPVTPPAPIPAPEGRVAQKQAGHQLA